MSALNVKNWTRYAADQRHPFWWGIMLLIVIEGMVVAGFIVSYFYLWIVNLSKDTPWPPLETPLPPVTIPTINTVLILLCSASMYYGGIVMDKNQQKKFLYSVIFCCITSSVVLYLRWVQLESLPFKWSDNAYASFTWVLSGFHFMHLLSALLGTVVIGWFSYKGFYHKDRQLGVQVDTFYWYFVSLAWLPMYLVIYWFPRIYRS